MFNDVATFIEIIGFKTWLFKDVRLALSDVEGSRDVGEAYILVRVPLAIENRRGRTAILVSKTTSVRARAGASLWNF